jgi:hypothetical protein
MSQVTGLGYDSARVARFRLHRNRRMDPMHDPDTVGAAVFLALVLIVPVWRIVRRTGRHPALSLLIFFPGIGIILIAFILAFGRWPALEGNANRVEK